MCVEESSDVAFDEVKVKKEIQIDSDKKKKKVVGKAPTPHSDEGIHKKELEFHKYHSKDIVIGSPLQGEQTVKF